MFRFIVGFVGLLLFSLSINANVLEKYQDDDVGFVIESQDCHSESFVTGDIYTSDNVFVPDKCSVEIIFMSNVVKSLKTPSVEMFLLTDQQVTIRMQIKSFYI